MAALEALFIVGMPRSGTKLLRDLLNRHSEVSIFPHETHFIPYFYRRFHVFGDVTQRSNFARFFRELRHTTFYQRMCHRGLELDEEHCFSKLRGVDYAAALEALFLCYGDMQHATRIGDKTPSYVTQVPLLHGLFPNAKFIHVVRDPRDYALSMQKAWGKSLRRSVQRWKAQVRRFAEDAAREDIRFRQVRFEDLLDDPQETLEELCEFVDVAFEPTMLTLAKPSENLGDARGTAEIVRNNHGKWRRSLSAREVAAIEAIAGTVMSQLGYPIVHGAGDVDVNALRMQLERCYDGFNLFRFRLREEGGLSGAVGETLRASRYRAVKE